MGEFAAAPAYSGDEYDDEEFAPAPAQSGDAHSGGKYHDEEFAAAPVHSGDEYDDEEFAAGPAQSGDEYDDEDIAARPSRSGDEYDDEEFAQEDYELQRPDDDDMRVPDAGADSHGPGVQDEEYDDEYSDQEFARQSQYLDESLSDQAGARTELRDERHLPARSPSRFGQVGRESDEEDSYSDAEPAKESQVLGRQRGEPPLEESSADVHSCLFFLSLSCSSPDKLSFRKSFIGTQR